MAWVYWFTASCHFLSLNASFPASFAEFMLLSCLRDFLAAVQSGSILSTCDRFVMGLILTLGYSIPQYRLVKFLPIPQIKVLDDYNDKQIHEDHIGIWGSNACRRWSVLVNIPWKLANESSLWGNEISKRKWWKKIDIKIRIIWEKWEHSLLKDRN